MTVGYVKSCVVSDPSKKMAVVHQYNEGKYVILMKELKKTVAQVIYERVKPSEMEFSVQKKASFKGQGWPAFGKWLFTSTDSGEKLNYIEYDPTASNSMKSSNDHPLTAGSAPSRIIGVSDSFDCVLIEAGDSVLNLLSIDNTGGFTTVADVLTTVRNDIPDDFRITLSSYADSVHVGDGCWAFKIGQYVYIKAVDGNTFVRPTGTRMGAVYDSSLKLSLVVSTDWQTQISTAKLFQMGVSGYE